MENNKKIIAEEELDLLIMYLKYDIEKLNEELNERIEKLNNFYFSINNQ